MSLGGILRRVAAGNTKPPGQNPQHNTYENLRSSQAKSSRIVMLEDTFTPALRL